MLCAKCYGYLLTIYEVILQINVGFFVFTVCVHCVCIACVSEGACSDNANHVGHGLRLWTFRNSCCMRVSTVNYTILLLLASLSALFRDLTT